MHYLFRGLRRGVGEPVTGRIIAPTEEAVHKVLESHAIIVDTLGPEEAGGLFPPMLEEALEEAGLRINFNQMARVHEGHGVWSLHHDKIRGRVMQLTREALGNDEARQPARRRIEEVLEILYGDKRPDAGSGEVAVHGQYADAEEVRAEIRRLMAAMNKLERELISIRSRSPAERSAPRRAATSSGPRDRTQDDVLREIFQHNLELLKLTQGQGTSAPAG
ncbi:MAG: hypothetical protein ACYTGR_02670 [Planctomycetota bacterium]